jgi:hypothetical protein
LQNLFITIDIDIANAHPCILSQLCSKNNWPSPKLQDYVNNREFYLQSVMDRCIVTRNQAKELFLRLSYGGTFVKWMRDELIDFSDISKHPPHFVAEFERELRTLRNLIVHAKIS